MNQQSYGPSFYPRRINHFNKACTTLAVLSVGAMISLIFTHMTPFLGCMSILFGQLSRQDSLTMPKSAKISSIVSGAAVILSILIIVLSFALVIHLFGWETVSNPELLMEAYMDYLENLGMMDPSLMTPETGGAI